MPGCVCATSTALHALCVHIKRVDRMAGRHEQAVALGPAEADIGGALGQADVADRLTFRVEDAHTIELRRAHAPAAPEIAVHVDTEAVRGLFFRASNEL